MTPEQAAAETGDGNTSAMVEIGRVYLRFAAACRGMVPLGAIFAFFLVNACVNRRSVVLFLCCCVAAGDYWSVLAGSEAVCTGG